MKKDIARLALKLMRGELNKRKRRKKSAPLLIAVLTIAVFALTHYLGEGDSDAPLPPKGAELSCAISNVYDGDTVTANCAEGKLKIRVWGIDAPEMGQKPWGPESRDAMRELTPSSKVRIEVVDTDRYGRVVARLFDNSKDLGLALVRQGRAIVYERYNKSKDYKNAEAQAKREKLGVWSKRGAQQNPEQWRRVNART